MCSSRGKNKLHRARAGVIQNGKAIDSRLGVVSFQSSGLPDVIDSSFDVGCGEVDRRSERGRERVETRAGKKRVEDEVNMGSAKEN